MSRIVNPDSAGKQRNQLTKATAIAVRELSRQSSFGEEARDLAAFMAVALKSIAEGIDASVAAWEKRGYWVKADRFRMEWDWAAPTSAKLLAALEKNDWPAIATLSMQVAQHFNKVTVAEHHRLGKPWVGAYKRLQSH